MIALLPLSLVHFATATSDVAEHPRLLQAQIIIRNADSAPVHEFTSPESAKHFPRGLGEVTDEGLLRAALQGADFKQRYSELGLLREETNDGEVFIRSSPSKRALMSAAAFSGAFMSEPQIHTTGSIGDERVLIVNNSIEHRCEVLKRRNMLNRPFCLTAQLLAAFVRETTDCAQFTYPKIEAALAEVEHSTVRLDGALERCARGDGRRILFKALSIHAGAGEALDERRLRDVIGPLLAIVASRIDAAVLADVIDGEQREPLLAVYYGDAEIVLAAAQALGIISEFGGRSPEFSSAIAIETWSSSVGFDIKIILKDGQHKQFKFVAKSHYLDFKKQISPYTSRDLYNVQWDEMAIRVYTNVDFDKDTVLIESDAIFLEQQNEEIPLSVQYIEKSLAYALYSEGVENADMTLKDVFIEAPEKTTLLLLVQILVVATFIVFSLALILLAISLILMRTQRAYTRML